MRFEKSILTILFKNAKLRIKKKKKKQLKFSQILGWLEKGKQTFSFLGLM